MNFKLKNKYLLTLCVIVLNTITFSGLKAQAKADDKTSAKAFVQGFYDWYVPLYNAEKIDYAGALAKKPNYFSNNLAQAIIRDGKEVPENAGEILGLDFDPLLGAQDNGFDYQAGNVRQADSKFWIDIHSGLTGKSKKEILAKKVVLVVETQKISGQWKIINFDYPDSRYPTDLLTVLNNLRKERNEWLVKHHQKPHTN